MKRRLTQMEIREIMERTRREVHDYLKETQDRRWFNACRWRHARRQRTPPPCDR